MPNWCENRLRVSGPESAVAVFAGSVCSDDGIFRLGVLLPPPLELDDPVEVGGWCEEQWGVDREIISGNDVGAHLEERSAGTIMWWFLSAWAPPEAWVEFAARRFPTLEFELGYEESGLQFAGMAIFVAGEKVPDRSWVGDPSVTLWCSAAGCENELSGPKPWEMSGPRELTDEQEVEWWCPDHEEGQEPS